MTNNKTTNKTFYIKYPSTSWTTTTNDWTKLTSAYQSCNTYTSTNISTNDTYTWNKNISTGNIYYDESTYFTESFYNGVFNVYLEDIQITTDNFVTICTKDIDKVMNEYVDSLDGNDMMLLYEKILLKLYDVIYAVIREDGIVCFNRDDVLEYGINYFFKQYCDQLDGRLLNE